jgi:hypothetical protein
MLIFKISFYSSPPSGALSSRERLTSNNLKIVKTYLNFDTEKEKIIKENRGKSGIYRLTKTGSFYVESSIDLKYRFLRYYNVNNLRNPKCSAPPKISRANLVTQTLSLRY